MSNCCCWGATLHSTRHTYTHDRWLLFVRYTTKWDDILNRLLAMHSNRQNDNYFCAAFLCFFVLLHSSTLFMFFIILCVCAAFAVPIGFVAIVSMHRIVRGSDEIWDAAYNISFIVCGNSAILIFFLLFFFLCFSSSVCFFVHSIDAECSCERATISMMLTLCRVPSNHAINSPQRMHA